jgi:amidohydrolase
MDLREGARRLQPDLVELRHALHREPEVGLQLPLTQRKVLSALGDLGLEITTGEGLSSVVGVLRGGKPGPTVLLRGDMDGLPVGERAEVAYSSQVDGAMHACGHDLHTSMLVGAAHLLAERRDQLAGNVCFMFQPGEEGWDGAGHMLAEGVLEVTGDRPVAAYALHVMSSLWPNGTFASRPGPLMAESGALSVTVKGTGGHGSAPHLARDPIPAACEMVLALQTYLTRSIDAFEVAVITVGSFHAGTRRNIIPETVEFDATVRTFVPEIRDQIAREAVRVCQGIATAHGLEVDVAYHAEYPVTVNTPDEMAFAASTVGELFGSERFTQMANPLTGSEDFSRIISEVSGAMVFLGAAPEGPDFGSRPNNHSPFASFEDSVLADGATLYAELAQRRLARADAAGVVDPGAADAASADTGAGE